MIILLTGRSKYTETIKEETRTYSLNDLVFYIANSSSTWEDYWSIDGMSRRLYQNTPSTWIQLKEIDI